MSRPSSPGKMESCEKPKTVVGRIEIVNTGTFINKACSKKMNGAICISSVGCH